MHVPASERLFSFPQNRTTFPPFILDKTKIFSKIHLYMDYISREI
jgi:hypothetical protein